MTRCKTKLISVLISFVISVIILAGQAVPVANAAAGDANIFMWDVTAGSAVINCTTSVSPCSVLLTSGHQYSITLTEVMGSNFNIGLIRMNPEIPPHTLIGDWPFANRNDMGGYAVSPPCNEPASIRNVNTTTSWYVSGTADPSAYNCINYLYLNGTANHDSDGFIDAYVQFKTGTAHWVTVNINTP